MAYTGVEFANAWKAWRFGEHVSKRDMFFVSSSGTIKHMQKSMEFMNHPYKNHLYIIQSVSSKYWSTLAIFILTKSSVCISKIRLASLAEAIFTQTPPTSKEQSVD
jgi:hypothetical protein